LTQQTDEYVAYVATKRVPAALRISLESVCKLELDCAGLTLTGTVEVTCRDRQAFHGSISVADMVVGRDWFYGATKIECKLNNLTSYERNRIINHCAPPS
jgi:hypothetical protein